MRFTAQKPTGTLDSVAPAASAPNAAATEINLTAEVELGSNGSAVENSSAPPSKPFEAGPCGNVPTSLGYQCSFTTPEGVTIHWSNGTALPKNPCTISGSGTPETAQNPPKNFMHFAAQAEFPEGRLELAFPDEPGAPYPAEVVYGFSRLSSSDMPGVRGNAFTMLRKNTRDKSFSGTWASYKGVYRSNDTRILTICFSRLRQSNSMATGRDVSAEIALNWAIYQKNEPNNNQEKPLKFGSAIIDVGTGVVRYVASNRSTIAAFHGILMLLSFVVLLPAGALLSRHRWLFKDFQGETGPAWLLAHLGVQFLAILTGIAGVLTVICTFGNTDPGSSMWRWHQVLGIITIGMAMLQVPLGVMRPESGSKAHASWFALHSNWGRLTCAAGIANVFIGTILVHDVQGSSYTTWVLPAVVLCAGVLCAALALEVKLVELQQEGEFMPTSYAVLKARGSRNSHAGMLAAIKTRRNGGSNSSGLADKMKHLMGDVADAIGSPMSTPGSLDLFHRKRRSTHSGHGGQHSYASSPTASSNADSPVVISYV